jgi:diguanylate cyclase (GGDEF)-like protein
MRGVFRKVMGCPNCTLAAFGALFACAIAVLFMVDLHSRYVAAIAGAKQATSNYAGVLAEHTARAFENVERSLRVVEIVRRDAQDGGRRIPADAASQRAHEVLRQLQLTSPLIVGLGWTNAAGDLQVHSYEHAPPRPNLAETPHFIAQRDNTDGKMFIAPPFRSTRTGDWLTAASLRLTNPDGSVAGIASAALDPGYFSGIYRSIDLGTGGAVVLFHRAGTMVTREPMVESSMGRSYLDGPLMARHLPKAEAGSYETVSVVDGIARIAGYHSVPDLPLIVLVTFSRADVLAPWFRHLYTFGPMAAFVILVILLGTALLMRQTRKIAEKSTVLELTLDNIAHGLVMVDTDLRLIICNKRYADMYGLTGAQTRPGTPLRDILEARMRNGNGLKDGGDFVARRLVEASRNDPFHTVMRLTDGRMVAITHQPVPGIGGVAIHQDVTAEKRAEASLIANSQELERANMRFNAALNNMSQGLCMFDARQRIVVSNQRFREIYGFGPDQVKPGTTVRQLLEYRIANGSYFGPAPDEYLRTNLKRPSDMETLRDGRVISLLRHPMPDGGWLTTYEDISERRRSEAKVAFMAHHDLLTGLANRTLFMEKIEEAGARLRRHGEAFTVVMLDLDRFKNVNDSLGHPAGDALLKEMAQRLKSSLRETDVLARLGGDEFAILQSGGAAQRDDAITLSVRIIDVVAQPFDLDGHKVSVGASIGIALAPQDGVEPDELLKKADLALYLTKSEGRNGFNFFHADMTTEADARHQMEYEMREALMRNEFELHYQPVLDVRTREPRGAEALVRWRHPRNGLIMPDRFIPLAEDTGLIVQLGAWILGKACADAASWPAQFKLAVNLSPVQFRKGDLFEVILCALVESGLPPERLELEITESVLLENEANYRVLLQQLKNIGVSIVLDDFGTGYSSLGYLTRFPVDKIKIDKSFTQGLSQRADCAAIVSSVVTLAHGLDIATTAEGVETEEQFELLRAAGVTQVQGFLFGRPCAMSELGFVNAKPGGRATAAA